MSALQPAIAVCGIFVAYMQGVLTKQVLKMKLGTIALSFLIHLRLIVATCVICAQAHRPPALCGLHQWRRQRHHHFCHCHLHQCVVNVIIITVIVITIIVVIVNVIIRYGG